MERRVVPKKRVGLLGDRIGRSMRKRQDKVSKETLNAAERSTCRYISVSLCGIPLELTKTRCFLPLTGQVPLGGQMEVYGKKRNKNEKEVKKAKMKEEE